MKKWEYKHFRRKSCETFGETVEFMNELGRYGHEIVYVNFDPYQTLDVITKREIPEPTEPQDTLTDFSVAASQRGL